MDVFEAMETCRAIRFFKKDPVPDEMIEKIIYAATRAPSPGNSQGWDFVIVTDRGVKEKLSHTIRVMLEPAVHAMEVVRGGFDKMDPVERRMLKGALNLAETLPDVPVIVLVCGKAVYPPDAPAESFVWSALYPAAQNILLAARALGLGSCMTTFHSLCEADLHHLLGIPKDMHVGAFIPIGWPDIEFGPLARKPIEEVIHREKWEG